MATWFSSMIWKDVLTLLKLHSSSQARKDLHEWVNFASTSLSDSYTTKIVWLQSNKKGRGHHHQPAFFSELYLVLMHCLLGCSLSDYSAAHESFLPRMENWPILTLTTLILKIINGEFYPNVLLDYNKPEPHGYTHKKTCGCTHKRETLKNPNRRNGPYWSGGSLSRFPSLLVLTFLFLSKLGFE